ncbi:RecA-superfamily ATPase [Aeropyrum camini SY1 = JCM 12091]|uniref:RecA-superfamily ATPase n=1 Tax=Aeropyrum camini SY1 = JCM 12091 TaxID=1198449 RepID=U3TDE7_9CREN|nr:RecA-superfamily ATPase [Aeropyrum camini SY1 = JCM 12091]
MEQLKTGVEFFDNPILGGVPSGIFAWTAVPHDEQLSRVRRPGESMETICPVNKIFNNIMHGL